MVTAGFRYRCRFSCPVPAWMACTGQAWMHAQQSSQWWFQTGFPPASSIFSAGQTAAQVPQDVHFS